MATTSSEQFKNPIEFLKSVRDQVAPYGICRIVPPPEWDRDCFWKNVNPDHFRFPTKVQSVHQFLHRKGPAEKFIYKVKKFWTRSGAPLGALPFIDGMEVDLYRLNEQVQRFGGFEQMDAAKWREVAAALHLCPDAPSVASHLSRAFQRVLQPFLEYKAAKAMNPGSNHPTSAAAAAPAAHAHGADSQEQAQHQAHHQQPNSNTGWLNREQSAMKPLGTATNQRNHSLRAMEQDAKSHQHSLQGADFRVTRSQLQHVDKLAVEVIEISDSEEEDADADEKKAHLKKEEDKEEIMPSYTRSRVAAKRSHSEIETNTETPAPPTTAMDHDQDEASTNHNHPSKRRKTNSSTTSWRDVRLNSFNARTLDDKVSDCFCIKCGLGDRPEELVICDGDCYRGLHIGCFDPPLDAVPEDEWFCDRCAQKRKQDMSGEASIEEEEESAVEVDVDEFGYGSGKSYSLSQFKHMAQDFEKRWLDPWHALDGGDEETASEDSEAGDRAARLKRFSKQRCDQIEKEYWRIINSGDSRCVVTYGSDLDVGVYGSGFPVDVNAPDTNPEVRRWRRHAIEHRPRRRNTEYMVKCGWNLNNLPYVSALQFLNESAGGVTRPMIYVGMMFSSFCWHTEDNFLYSINYVHSGAPKRWYGVPSEAAELVEQAFQGEVPDLLAQQPNLLYLLITQLPPDVMLKKYRVPVCTTLQREGEFVITFPRSYHAGFNCGFNIAESVNFAAPDWLAWGRRAMAEYRNKRSSVFALEEFLTKAAMNCRFITDAELARAVRDELRTSLDSEFEVLEKFASECPTLRWHYLSPTECNEECKQCEVCGFDCYLFSATCDCRKGTYKCLHHAQECGCPASRKTIVARFSLDSLKQMLLKVEGRARNLELFNPMRTRRALSSNNSPATAKAK